MLDVLWVYPVGYVLNSVGYTVLSVCFEQCLGILHWAFDVRNALNSVGSTVLD